MAIPAGRAIPYGNCYSPRHKDCQTYLRQGRYGDVYVVHVQTVCQMDTSELTRLQMPKIVSERLKQFQ